MLYSTFQHIPGFGAKKEIELWKSGIFNWDQVNRAGIQLGIFQNNENDLYGLYQSKMALQQGDSDYFANRLHKSEYYRIALSFPQNTLFLDIETTGLSRYYNEITIVGWSYLNDFDFYIKGDDPGKLYAAFAKAKAVSSNAQTDASSYFGHLSL